MTRIGKTSALAGIAIALMVALALGASARPWSGSGGTGRMLDQLDLSEESRGGLEALMERSREETRPLREALQREHEALEALLRDSPVDMGAALDQVERVGEARTALEKQRVIVGIEMQALLTDDERQAWNDAKEMRRERRHRMFRRFRDRDGHGEMGGPEGREGFDLFGFEPGSASGTDATPLP